MKHGINRAVALATTIAVAVATTPVSAQHNHEGTPAGQSKMMGDTKGVAMGDMKGGVEGEVRRVDKANGKVTLRHGEIKQFEMPPMTMVFEVSDRAILENVKAGDKVNFKLVNESGKLIVTEIKPSN